MRNFNSVLKLAQKETLDFSIALSIKRVHVALLFLLICCNFYIFFYIWDDFYLHTTMTILYCTVYQYKIRKKIRVITQNLYLNTPVSPIKSDVAW